MFRSERTSLWMADSIFNSLWKPSNDGRLRFWLCLKDLYEQKGEVPDVFSGCILILQQRIPSFQ